MKKVKLLVTSLLCATALASCGGGNGGGEGEISIDSSGGEIVFKNVNITFSNVITGTDNSYLTTLINTFNNEFKGQIKVTSSAVQPADLYDNLPTSTAYKKNADVVLMHAERVLQFAGQKNSEGTSKYFRELEDIMELAQIHLDSEDFPAQVWSNMRLDEHQYGIPFDMHMAGIYVNKTILNELNLDMPTNRDELVNAAQKAIEKGYKGMPISTGYPDTYSYINGYFNHGGKQILVEGDEGFDPEQKLTDGTVVPAQPGVYYKNACLNAVKSFGELIFDDHISDPKLAVDTNLNEFYNGRSLFCLDGIWLLNDVIRYSTAKKFDFDVLPASMMYKEESNTEYTGDIYTNGHIFVMPKNNMGGEKVARQQASMKFISWMLDHSADWAKSGKIAAYGPARETEEYKAIKYLDGFGEIDSFRCLQANRYAYAAFSPSQQVNTFVMNSDSMPSDEAINEKIAQYYKEGIALVKSDISSGN
ncbi:MAG: extracellular solute-binding protein [Bacilli bacterium]|nr:extracellular solute-binding protein [Bacilli bacterium]